MGTIAFLFPGQGAHAVGMGKDFYSEFKTVRKIFKKTESLTGIEIRKLCFDGPMQDLTQTANLQPCLTVMNLSILAALKERTSVSADFCAGHSLGEYSALYCANVLSFENTIRVVMKRGRLMQREANIHPGKMLAILKLPVDKVEEILNDYKPEGPIGIANYNSQSQTVIAGAADIIKKISKHLRKSGGLCVPLNVSGAWHSELVWGAYEEFESYLNEISFHSAAIPNIFNTNADIENDPNKIKTIMSKQFCQPVRWSDSVLKLASCKVDTFIEIGPGKVLTGLLSKILPSDYSYRAYNIDTLDSLNSFIADSKVQLI